MGLPITTWHAYRCRQSQVSTPATTTRIWHTSFDPRAAAPPPNTRRPVRGAVEAAGALPFPAAEEVAPAAFPPCCDDVAVADVLLFSKTLGLAGDAGFPSNRLPDPTNAWNLGASGSGGGAANKKTHNITRHLRATFTRSAFLPGGRGYFSMTKGLLPRRSKGLHECGLQE